METKDIFETAIEDIPLLEKKFEEVLQNYDLELKPNLSEQEDFSMEIEL